MPRMERNTWCCRGRRGLLELPKDKVLACRAQERVDTLGRAPPRCSPGGSFFAVLGLEAAAGVGDSRVGGGVSCLRRKLWDSLVCSLRGRDKESKARQVGRREGGGEGGGGGGGEGVAPEEAVARAAAPPLLLPSSSSSSSSSSLLPAAPPLSSSLRSARRTLWAAFAAARLDCGLDACWRNPARVKKGGGEGGGATDEQGGRVTGGPRV